MDWTLIGVLAGVAALAGVVAYGSFVLVRSKPEPVRFQSSAVLIPARELSPVVDASAMSNAPVTGYSSAAPYSTPRLESAAPANRSDPIISEPMGSRLNDYLPPADSGSHASRRKAMTEDKVIASLENGQRVEHNEVKRQPQIGSESWKVEKTAKASYFNLGGHIDKDGVVDSLASSYLRDALKKHKNYATLPTQIKASIDTPNVNLAKIAGYRALFGIDDKKMEAEQGVKFVKITRTRGIEINDETADQGAVPDIDTSPMDLSPLHRMDLDLRREVMLGLGP